jgi:hypothetical protein
MLTQFLHFISLHFTQADASSEARLAGSLPSKEKILTSMITFASWLIMKCVSRGLADADGMLLSEFATHMRHTQVVLAIRHKAVCAQAGLARCMMGNLSIVWTGMPVASLVHWCSYAQLHLLGTSALKLVLLRLLLHLAAHINHEHSTALSGCSSGSFCSFWSFRWLLCLIL